MIGKSGSAAVSCGGAFNGVKVFSATTFPARQQLGETVTAWIEAHPGVRIVDVVQTQSSDEAYHCIAISVFYLEEPHPEQSRRLRSASRNERNSRFSAVPDEKITAGGSTLSSERG